MKYAPQEGCSCFCVVAVALLGSCLPWVTVECCYPSCGVWVHGRRVHGCSEGRCVSVAQAAPVPSSCLNSQWINTGAKSPGFPWCGVMKTCSCHPGSPGTLLLPTNMPAMALLSVPISPPASPLSLLQPAGALHGPAPQP